jgi:hypothetical protein
MDMDVIDIVFVITSMIYLLWKDFIAINKKREG